MIYTHVVDTKKVTSPLDQLRGKRDQGDEKRRCRLVFRIERLTVSARRNSGELRYERCGRNSGEIRYGAGGNMEVMHRWLAPMPLVAKSIALDEVLDGTLASSATVMSEKELWRAPLR